MGRFGPRRAEEPQMVGLEGQISGDDSSPHAYVIPTDEEILIARHTVRCIPGEPHPS